METFGCIGLFIQFGKQNVHEVMQKMHFESFHKEKLIDLDREFRFDDSHFITGRCGEIHIYIYIDSHKIHHRLC